MDIGWVVEGLENGFLFYPVSFAGKRKMPLLACMEFLRALHDLLSGNRLKKIELITNEPKGRKASLPVQLFHLLDNKDIQTDDQAANVLFGKPPNSKYRMLKMRTKQMMLNSIFFLDEDKMNFPTQLKRRNECARNVYTIRLLYYAGKLKAAKKLADNSLKIAEQFELWNEAIFLLRFLKNMSNYNIDFKKYHGYNERLKWCLKAQWARFKTEELNEAIEMNFRSAKINTSEIAKKAKENAARAKKFWEKYGGFYIGENYWRLLRNAYFLEDNYVEGEKTLDNMEAHYEEYSEFVHPGSLGEIYNARIYSAIYLKEYETGHKYAQKGFEIAPGSRISWFLLAQFYFPLLMHDVKYVRAKKLAEEALSNPLEEMPQQQPFREQWEVYRGYADFACQAFLAPHEEGSILRINKLLNELNVFTAYKEGLNAAALILEVLIFFLRKDYPAIIDRMPGLKKYKKRNLKIRETTRCRIFINLIEIAVKSSFLRVEATEASKATFEALSAAKLGPEGNVENIEIIPFERLWQWILENLD